MNDFIFVENEILYKHFCLKGYKDISERLSLLKGLYFEISEVLGGGVRNEW